MQRDKHTPSPLIMAATLGALGAPPPGGRGAQPFLRLGSDPGLGQVAWSSGLPGLPPRDRSVILWDRSSSLPVSSSSSSSLLSPPTQDAAQPETLRDAVQPDGSASTGGRHLGCQFFAYYVAYYYAYFMPIIMNFHYDDMPIILLMSMPTIMHTFAGDDDGK